MVREGPSESGNQEQPRGKGVEGEGWGGRAWGIPSQLLWDGAHGSLLDLVEQDSGSVGTSLSWGPRWGGAWALSQFSPSPSP